jgi:DNA-binding transcriptional LysR family regulator
MNTAWFDIPFMSIWHESTEKRVLRRRTLGILSRMDRLAAMNAFVRVAERGSFSAAARDLRVGQPFVSRMVQHLERELGARLLHRTTRALTLTDAGLEYLRRSRAILAAVADAHDAVSEGGKKLSGELRIFAPVSLGRAWVVPQLGEFMARHPALAVNVVLDDRPRDLVADRLDVGLRIGPLPEGGHRARRLGDIERWLVAAPSYWAKRGRPRQPAELEAHEALIYDGTIVVDRVQLHRGVERAEVPLKGRFRSNSPEAIAEAMLLGRGFTPAPNWLVARELKSGALERVLDDWRVMPPLVLYATYPQTREPPLKVRRFIDWMVHTLEADGLFDDRVTAQGASAPRRRTKARG